MPSEDEEKWPLRGANLWEAGPEILAAVEQRIRQMCWACRVYDDNQVDDVHQAVLLKIKTGNGVYNDRRRLLAHVCLLARGCVTEDRRWAEHLRPLENAQDAGASVADELQRVCDLIDVNSVMAELPGNLREVLRLSLDGLGVADIANALGLSRATAYRRLTAARDAAASKLGLRRW